MAMKPRQRQRLFRWVMYAIAAVVVGLAVLVGDWERIGFNFFNLEVMGRMFPEVLTIAARNTILYTLMSFAIGLVGALVLALMKLSTIAPYRAFAIGYIELFRGLPALITLILIGFGIPIAFDFRMPGGRVGAGVLGLSIVAAAYMAETIRAGIEAVPRGQSEAARSLGMSQNRTMYTIVLPQAFRIIIPPLTNEMVLLIKDTSLFFVLGTTPLTKELTKFARDFMVEIRNATPLTVAALVYLAITLPLTWLVRRLEKRAAVSR
ncbi:MAG TPA: amino acid ABC transporter permease [Acidimicrobiia bacterium]|nr:amino acid ABC transporter permease [Acidimicrobiia bacterium]